MDEPTNGRRSFLKAAGRGAAGLGLGLLSLPAAACGTAREALPGSLPGALPDPDDADFWKAVRRQFPLTHERIYLNSGGLGPAPYPVVEAVQRTLWAQQTISEHGHHLIEEARAPVAAFLGAKPSEIALLRNATEGNSTVAMGLDLRPGDEVVFESHAHPGGAYAWMNRQKQDGIRVRIFEPDPASAAGNLERIEAQLTPKTRVIQVSHVTAPTGIRMPVEDIARLAKDRGLWFHVDGAQTAGMFPVDVHAIGCDSYATSGHKWMGGPHGSGALFVREDRLDEVVPTEIGSYSDGGDVHLPDRFNYNPTAQRYEPGTRDAATVVGLVAAVAFLEGIGMARVGERGQALARYLQAKLRTLPGVTVLTPEDAALSASMTTLKADRVPYQELNRYYAEHGLRCRVVGERGIDGVRVSTHLYNDFADCDRVVEATQAALRDA